jgi:hypothetical protein
MTPQKRTGSPYDDVVGIVAVLAKLAAMTASS